LNGWWERHQHQHQLRNQLPIDLTVVIVVVVVVIVTIDCPSFLMNNKYDAYDESIDDNDEQHLMLALLLLLLLLFERVRKKTQKVNAYKTTTVVNDLFLHTAAVSWQLLWCLICRGFQINIVYQLSRTTYITLTLSQRYLSKKKI